MYDQFVSKVAEGRNMNKEQVDAIGKGRVWTGSQGKEIGLVDEIGGLSKAIQLAKELAGIPAKEQVQLVVQPKKVSFFDMLFGQKFIKSELGIDPAWEKALVTYRLLKRENIWALMPFWILSD
jgi:protease-4